MQVASQKISELGMNLENCFLAPNDAIKYPLVGAMVAEHPSHVIVVLMPIMLLVL